jgi:hypothetical protein
VVSKELSYNNVGKTVVMSIHSRQKKCPIRPSVTFNKMHLIHSAETKFLLVYITETLQRNTHEQSLAKKLGKISFMS